MVDPVVEYRVRPRPDETKRVPKLCGTNEAKEESEFYKEASDCFEFNTLDWGKQQECLRLHGCPDDDRNRKQSSYCNDWCPRSKFFAPWSSKSWLQSCINTASAAANHLLAKANCVVPKVDTDAFMNDWWKSKQSPPTPPILAYEPREPTRPRFDPTRPRTVEQ